MGSDRGRGHTGFDRTTRGRMKPFTVSAILTRISYLKDGGLSIGFSTMELTDEEKVIASKYHGKQGWLGFKENEITIEDFPEEDAATDETKSQSQRLRAVLYVWWKQERQNTISVDDFEKFYRHHMERIINKYKTFLE